VSEVSLRGSKGAVAPFEILHSRALRRLLTPATTHVIMIVVSIVMIFPFVTMLLTSLMTLSQAYSFPPDLIPKPLTIAPYFQALELRPFHIYLLNSLLVAIVITAGRLFTCSLGAFAFARLQFPGRDVIFWIYLSTLMLPEQVTLIPLFFIIKNFGWIDRYQGLTIPFLVTAFGVFLLRQFFLTIPRELEDAAIIDGCGPFGLYWRIILPLAVPGLAALGVLTFVNSYNMFVWPLIVTNSDAMRTIVVGIGLLTADNTNLTNWPRMMAISSIAVIPSVLIFIVGQRYFVQGITLSGLKG
jgi:ABC-type glycerol-3-phosphate transport system permease component